MFCVQLSVPSVPLLYISLVSTFQVEKVLFAPIPTLQDKIPFLFFLLVDIYLPGFAENHPLCPWGST